MQPRLTLITAQNMASACIMHEVIEALHPRIERVIILNNFPLSNWKEIKAFFRLIRRCGFSFLVFKFMEVWGHYLISIARGERIDQLCRRRGVKTHHFGSADDPGVLALLQQESPDYLVSTGPAILRAPVIACARKAVLNCHGAKLPEFRGPANYVWTLLQGETKRGVTIHRLVEKIDAGAVWHEAVFDIKPNWSVYEYDYYHALDSGRVLAQTLGEILDGKEMTEHPQDESRAVVRSFPGPADMAKFHKLGIPMWRWRDLWKCRGFKPF